MENKKPKVLDILRLIIAILTLIGVVIVSVSLIYAINNMFNDEEGCSGLVFIFIIPLVIGLFVYLFVAIRWIKKYVKTKNKPLLERNVTIAEPIVKGIIAVVFLSYISIPLIIYFVFDLVEAIRKNNLEKKLKAQQPKAEFRTNETHPITDKQYCKNCGKPVDYRYARFCEYCGSEIEYRK